MDRKPQNFVTICTRIIEPQTSYELDELDDLIYESLGNLKKSTVEKLTAINLIHFASMNVIKGHAEREPSYILLEMTIDGDPEEAIKKFISTFPTELIKIYGYANASLKTKAALTHQLLDDQYKITQSPMPSFFEAQSLNGLPFSGTSGLDLDDVADDAKIAEFAQNLIQETKSQAANKAATDGAGEGPNRPLDVFRYAKKKLIEQTTDFELSHAWKRATACKQSPNFAESMNSDWKERWNQFKLFASIVPAWVWATIALIYLAVLMLLTDQALVLETAKNCEPWDKVRYSGSPFFKSDDPIPSCISLKPSFLVQGIILSILLFAILRYSPLPTKRSSVSLTLLAGMAIHLVFPDVFNINHFNKTTVSKGTGPSSFLLLAWLAGLYCVLLVIYKLPKSGLMNGPFLSLAKLYNRFHQWIYFSAAIFLFCIFSYMGLRFFYGGQLGGIFSPPTVGGTAFDGASSKQAGYEFAHKFCLGAKDLDDFKCKGENTPRPTQFLFIPVVIAAIFIMSLQAITAHTPRGIRQIIRKARFVKKHGHKLKVQSKKIWIGMFFLVALMVFHAGFVNSSLDVPKLILDVFIYKVCLAIIAAIISTQILRLLSPSIVSSKKVFSIFSVAWILLLFSKYLFTETALEIYISVVSAIPITIVITALLAVIGLGLFLRSQNKHQQRYDNPYTDITEEIFDRENKVSQNHMISIQRLIPDVFRKNITLPLMLNAIFGVLGRQRFRPGFLANVGTVHSARWVHLPDTDNYVFLGNYDGSFESYLEDFSKMAIEGTNLAWGNCIGFPRIHGVFKGGVEDSDRFKRYARRSMKPTAFWYSAVSDKSAEQIRRNALIRDGLTQDSLSASEAQAWLDLFGSIPRPEWVLEADEIQNIMFGGNGGLRHGACYALKQHPKGPPISKSTISEWVDKIRSEITFSEAKQTEKSISVAFSAVGLRALGLDHVLDENFVDNEHHAMPTSSNPEYPINFSQPFVSGMADPTRCNILGDHGDSAPEKWDWSDKKVYAVVLIYASSESGLESKFKDLKPDSNSGLILEGVKTFKAKSVCGKIDREPFGFADGISQPILKGTAKGRKYPQSIHIVEAGEFILGYRDNRGHFPPSPIINEKHDVSDLLPNQTADLIQRYPNFSSPNRSSQRSLGRNGSYLVIRELFQDVAGFHEMSRKAAAEIVSQRVMELPHQPEMAPQSDPSSALNTNEQQEETISKYADWVEHLLMGRHKDGTSLIDKDIKIEQNFGKAIKLTGEVNDPNNHRLIEQLKKENEFLFKDTDPQGHKCPFGSHVRRSNPRDGLMIESEDALAVSQRHRILRRGRSYEDAKGEDQGIFFMCLNADIDRQFEFLQQTWLLSSKFHGLRDEVDPIVGQAKSKDEEESYFTIQHPDGDIRIQGLQKFITMKGGGYFFMPGKSCLDFFANLKDAPIQD